MLADIAQNFSNEIQSISYMILVVNVLLHILFAGAVANDAGELNKTGQGTCLVSGVTWAFATLIGGIVTAAIYWFIHHSTLTRGN